MNPIIEKRVKLFDEVFGHIGNIGVECDQLTVKDIKQFLIKSMEDVLLSEDAVYKVLIDQIDSELEDSEDYGGIVPRTEDTYEDAVRVIASAIINLQQRKAANRVSRKSLTLYYGVSESHISNIISGKKWKHLEAR